jgi:tetratricopeptide (TPR) repeat protein
MAPEQARGDIEAIDVRTDVYALGMILYELVSGRRPYNVSGSALPEAVRVICEQSPRSLSASFSGTHRLDQDIDTIVTKALEKDADRRYSSVAAMAGDIERYLTSQPILARPPSASYQLRKLIQRHRAVFFATAAALLVFVAASVVSTGMYLRAEKARLEADQRAKELEEVSAFQSDMLAEIDISKAGQALMQEIRDRRTVTPGSAGDFETQLAHVNATDAVAAFLDRTIFKPAVQTIDAKYKEQPLVDAQLRLSVANSYIKLGRHQEALALTRQAYALRKRVLGEDHPETIRAMGIMADQTFDTEGPEKAEPYYREVLERRRRVLGSEHRDTLISITSYGNILGDLGRRDEAVALLRESLARKRRVYGEDHEETLVSINSLGYLLQNMGRLAEAEPLRREALQTSRRLLGEEHVDTLIYIVNMASLLEDLERYSEAETLYREAVSKRRRVLGELHPRTLGATHLLGSILRKQGKLDEAELLLRQVLTRRREVLGDEHRGTLHTTVALAALEADRGRGKEALDLIRPIETAGRKTFGASSADLAFMLITMGRAKAQVGDIAAAQAILLEASQLIQRDPASLPAHKSAAASALAELAAARGNATAKLAAR